MTWFWWRGGAEHRQLKEYIANHPSVVGATEQGQTEQIILSGDRLDVWFPCDKIAVEVKPFAALDSDILRSIYQCVKYKAVLDAEDAAHGHLPNSKVSLVIKREMSVSNNEVCKTLGVNVITLK